MMTARIATLSVAAVLLCAAAPALGAERVRPKRNTTGPAAGGGAARLPGTGVTAGPAGAAGEVVAEPEVRMEKAQDVVLLTDGTRIVGTIVAAGQKRLLIVKKGEQTETAIDRSAVESYRRGAGEGQVLTYRVETDTDRGVLVLREKDATDPMAGAAPGAGGAPAVEGVAPVKAAELGGLWKLLAGRPGADEIAKAFGENPTWAGAVAGLIREGRLPDEGVAAFAAFRTRLRSDVELRNGLAELALKGKLPPEVLVVLKGD